MKERIEDVKERVANAAVRSGRKPSDIRIVAVTKTVEPIRIQAAVDEGLIWLGENRVQELCEKHDTIKGPCEWHLIGHLQTNKVKYIMDKVKLIHSVDSPELMEEIQKRASAANRIMDILVQVNVAGEDTKFGIAPDAVDGFMQTAAKHRNIKVRGLMTIAPLTSDAESVRYVFRELRKIFIDIKRKSTDNKDMDTLSMGMSNDFETAIEEGSTMVRVGSAIFGKRSV